MANRKYELKMVIVIDDTIESIVNQLEQMKTEILTGEAQKEMKQADGVSHVVMTLKEIK